MRKFHLPFGIGKRVDLYSTDISKEEYKELMSYARAKNVKLEGFKRFSGKVSLIKEMIDDVTTIAADFPMIVNAKKCLVLSLDDSQPDADFATTIEHYIYINAKIFNNAEYLQNEYMMAEKEGEFVKGTNYRSVIRHELGHVVANMYKLNPMEIAKDLFPGKTQAEILEYIHDNLSLYASDYVDGREFISEYFSAYYSNVDIPFATEYINKCKELAKEREDV